MALFKPAETGARDPLDNSRQNGRVINPPRYAEMGGLKGSGKGVKKNNMTIASPGAVTSVKKGR